MQDLRQEARRCGLSRSSAPADSLDWGRDGADWLNRGASNFVSAAGVRSLVIDTQRSYLRQGNASKLAQWLGGQYLYLPGASGASIAATARQASQEAISA